MSCGLPTPALGERFTVRTVTSEDVPAWYHVFNTPRYPTSATTFAKGWEDTRFAPITQSDGTPVHTYYVASSRESVYMESVLHDVSLSPPGVFEVASLAHFHLVKMRLPAALRFVSFHTKDLPRLSLTRAQLVDSLTDCYPETRAWSQAAYLQCPKAQASGYGSRRDDSGRCLMLFGERLPAPPFVVLEEHCLADPPYRGEVLALVRSLEAQAIETRALMDRHKAEVRRLGVQLVDAERELDRMFRDKQATEAEVQRLTETIGKLQAHIRASHLQTHLRQTELLTAAQIERYNILRGYR